MKAGTGESRASSASSGLTATRRAIMLTKDRKSTRLNSSHSQISYAVFCLKKKEFNLGVVRGLDYYTGMVFEIDSPNLGAEKPARGGGPYSLAELVGGERVPQTAFAPGLDR